MAAFVEFGNLTPLLAQTRVGKLLCLSAFWERVSISTIRKNFTEIGPQSFGKMPFKHAPRKFGLDFFHAL